jgi:SRSO17 transposase
LAHRFVLRWFAEVHAVKLLFKSDEPSSASWEREFDRYFQPFFQELTHEAQQRWAPIYMRGLIGPGDRKSMEPMAARVCPGELQQLHHFVSTSRWQTAPLERVLLEKASIIVGGKGAHCIVDDVALPKQGKYSVGVARQYCGALGKNANCQVLVSITLARDELPVPVALRLYLPESWANSLERRRQAKIPDDVVFQEKWRIALSEVERVVESGVVFDDVVADAGYGLCAEFRHGLSDLGLLWAVGITPVQLVYSPLVQLTLPEKKARSGRSPKYAIPSESPIDAKTFFGSYSDVDFERVEWRTGTKGPMIGLFKAFRVRPADGAKVIGHNHGPGQEVWLVCELRENERKYYLSNYPANTTLKKLVSVIKARWACEQAHQQMKEELGLDHFEGRSWHGLHHHTLLTMMAFLFLQHLRYREKND